MAQKIFTPFGALVTSYELGEVYTGVFEPGVYRGFDSLSVESETEEQITVNIGHSKTGIHKVLPNNQYDTEPTGVLFMKNGMLVHDTNPVQITVSKADSLRADAIIGHIEYIENLDTPGVYFEYGVEEGVGLDYVSNDPKKMVIGFITWGYDSDQGFIDDAAGAPGTLPDVSIGYLRRKAPNLANKSDLDLPNFQYFSHLNQGNNFTGVNTFQSETRFNGLISKPLRQITASITDDGYIVIGGSNTRGTEFIMDLGGISAKRLIYGFRHENKPYSNAADGLRPGTSINIRFYNAAPGAVHFARNTMSIPYSKGFYLPSQALPIRNGILYTLRLESFSNATHGVFSISPHIGVEDLEKHKDEVQDLIIAQVSVGNKLLDHENGDIYYSFTKEKNKAIYLVTITVVIKADSMVSSGNTLLPTELRPPYVSRVDTDGGGYLLVHPNGQVSSVNSQASHPRTWSLSYLAGVDTA